MVPEFDKTVFTAPIGQISEPIKTQFGYYVFEVTKTRERKESKFADEQGEIIASAMEIFAHKREQAGENIAKAISSQENQFGRNHIEVAKSLSQYALIKFHNGDNRKAVEKLMLEADESEFLRIAARLGDNWGDPLYTRGP